MAEVGSRTPSRLTGTRPSFNIASVAYSLGRSLGAFEYVTFARSPRRLPLGFPEVVFSGCAAVKACLLLFTARAVKPDQKRGVCAFLSPHALSRVILTCQAASQPRLQRRKSAALRRAPV